MTNKGWTLAGVIIMLAVSGCGKDTEQDKPGQGKASDEKSIAVLAAPVVRGPISDLRHFSGSLEAVSRFVVAARVSGLLKNLHVDIGDSVERGQLIAEIDDAEFLQQFNQAKAELVIAEASVKEAEASADIARVEFIRAQSLRKQKIASQSELDQARAETQAKNARVDVTKAQLIQRQAALTAAEVRLGYSHIEALWNSPEPAMVVGQRFADEGELLNTHSPILSLAALDSLKAIFQVTAKDYPRIHVGKSATLTVDAYPGRNFEAVIDRVSPVLDPQSHQAQVELKLDNPGRLLSPGMFVRITLSLDHQTDALLVPVTTLVNKESGTGLYLINDDQTVQYVEVVIGIRGREQVQIIKPEISGSVVTLGQHLLKDGASVQIQNAPSATTQPNGKSAP